jgi:transcriptional regulator with XRE-family HTH domain
LNSKLGPRRFLQAQQRAREIKWTRGLESLFGAALREKRQGAGFSQARLASDIDVHRTYISRLERGLNLPSLAKLCRIGLALEVKISELVRVLDDIEAP